MTDHETFQTLVEEAEGQVKELAGSMLVALVQANTEHRQHWVGKKPEFARRVSMALNPSTILADGSTHEIIRREQAINTDLLPPTNTLICFPTIRKQLTERAFATKDEDPSSPFGRRDFRLALPERAKPTGATRFRAHQFGMGMKFANMIEAAGGLDVVKERHLVTQWQIRWAVEETMRRRKEDKVGPLRMDGWAEFFLVEADTEEGVAVVDVYGYRNSGYWGVCSYPLSRGHVWNRVNRLFLCADAA